MRPNILFIYTDDQAAWTTGFSGNEQAYTPNLDRLAAEGVSFSNCFVTTPVCSPARATLMTSRYATELGIPDFIPNPGHAWYDPDNEIGLEPETEGLAARLSRAGYDTALVGKWHLGDWLETGHRRYHPTTHGFHYFMGLTGGGTTPSDPPLEVDGEVRQFRGLTTDILTDYAERFIRENAADYVRGRRSAPFALFLNYRAPHKEWLPVADEDWAPYENLDIRLPEPDYPDLDVPLVTKMMREYLASVSGVDRNVGRLLSLLDELGLSEHTVVLFSSDNGYNMGHNGIWHKGNGIWATRTIPPDTENIMGKYRPNLYDHSLRVPGIIRWPSVVRRCAAVEPGTVIHRTVSNLDWMPTLAEVAEGRPRAAGEVSADGGAGGRASGDAPVRGRSVVPLLRGETPTDWDDEFFCEYSMQIYCRTHMRSYRTAEWKLVRDFLNPGRDELYHLTADPGESRNLCESADAAAKEAKQWLDSRIREKMEEIEDPLLERIAAWERRTHGSNS